MPALHELDMDAIVWDYDAYERFEMEENDADEEDMEEEYVNSRWRHNEDGRQSVLPCKADMAEMFKRHVFGCDEGLIDDFYSSDDEDLCETHTLPRQVPTEAQAPVSERPSPVRDGSETDAEILKAARCLRGQEVRVFKGSLLAEYMHRVNMDLGSFEHLTGKIVDAAVTRSPRSGSSTRGRSSTSR